MSTPDKHSLFDCADTMVRRRFQPKITLEVIVCYIKDVVPASPPVLEVRLAYPLEKVEANPA